ncbi:MAG: hypothetical protein JSW38_04150 [Dehalococcoidia bacterium]|nr:MAG: hypothetical protein JSW38_04150 [Dehalococcoidia bacterium]
MKCIDCHHLFAINGETLPDGERDQLKGRDPESFTWVVCGKAVEDFIHEQPQIFDEVLKERDCKVFTPLSVAGIGNKVVSRKEPGMPTRYKIAIIIAVLLAIIGATSGIILVIS